MSMNNAGYKNMVGGYTYNKSKSHKTNSVESSMNKSLMNKTSMYKGGGLIPQDLVNLGRDFEFNLKSAYNSLNGYKAPVDPLPYKGQLTGTKNVLV